ncbi:MAG: pyrimidine 5'-nucleotidase [Emcibacter sp.]|nr:pyrimidine 5'-nucleotidase [Emcibacter sp.]
MIELNKTDYWIFDLDNTLYPAENNLFSQVDRRMGLFISEKFNLPYDAAKNLQKQYFMTYGTTLKGLMMEHNIPPHDFLDYVHDINFDVLQKNDDLIKSIKKLRGTKFIYTNASRDYTMKVVDKIGLEGIFEDIFDIKSAEFNPKPDPESYHKMVSDMGIDPKCAVMVEDIARNLIPASKMGMKTVWVETDHKWSSEGLEHKFIDYKVPNLADWLKNLVKD